MHPVRLNTARVIEDQRHLSAGPGNLLLVEAVPGDADRPAHELTSMGREISFCRPPEGSAAPCIALHPGGHCPLASGSVRLLLDVRRDAATPATTGERGVFCALRQDIPIVVATPVRLQPEDVPWAAATCDLAEAAAFTAALSGRSNLLRDLRVERAVTRVLRSRAADVGRHTVRVTDWAYGPTVCITCERPANPAVCAALAYAVRDVLRPFQTSPSQVPVSFRSPRVPGDPGTTIGKRPVSRE